MNLAEMTWPAITGLPRKTPVVFPIAALEQHGRHLPVITDALLLGEVVRRVEQLPTGQRCLFAPVLWLGNSHHHLDFPGTLSLQGSHYLQVLQDLARCFIDHGFSRLVFLNGHGGNIVPAQHALFELKQDFRDYRELLLLSLTYWEAGGDPSGVIPGLVQRQMGHACEWETSMVLRLAPQWVVGDISQLPEVPFGTGFAPGHRAWVMPERSEPGHIGVPAAATAEKGEALLNFFAHAVADFLDKVASWDGSWS
ncbi:MAG: creatininase family protein [Gemmataceae bacterium]|nr:creatininase family protein [Gemmataceae bacterium]MCS7269793.1 creatininase family protein [Gemmataceae bacterium]MDW8242594.1 creatininase family protein [Thermogemmata sp.]